MLLGSAVVVAVALAGRVADRSVLLSHRPDLRGQPRLHRLAALVDRLPWLTDVHFAIDAVVVSAAVVHHRRRREPVLIALHAADRRREHGAVPPRRLAARGLSAILFLGRRRRAVLSANGYLDLPFRRSRRSGAAIRQRRAVHRRPQRVWIFRGRVAERFARRARAARRAQLEEATEEIADLQAFNQYVLDNLLSGLATADADNRLLTFNRSAHVDHRP